MSFRAERMDIYKIRYIANALRSKVGQGIDERLFMPHILDLLAVKWEDKEFNYQIVDDEDTTFLSPDEEAKTDVSSGTIYIKQSVYEQTCRKTGGRASFTIAHEIGHFVIHKMMNKVIFARNEANANVETGDPEWQANAFAAELLMPYEGCIGLSAGEIIH